MISSAAATSSLHPEHVEYDDGYYHGEEEQDELSVGASPLSSRVGEHDNILFSLSWSHQWRQWLRQKTTQSQAQQEENDQEKGVDESTVRVHQMQPMDHSDTSLLQEILSQLTSLPDWVEPDYVGHETHDDLMMMLAPTASAVAHKAGHGRQRRHPERPERLVRYWKQWERFFVLRDLRGVVWERCCQPVHRHLIRSIVQQIDRITGNTGATLPLWMCDNNKSKSSNAEQRLLPADVLNAYWKERRTIKAKRRAKLSLPCEEPADEALPSSLDTQQHRFVAWIDQNLSSAATATTTSTSDNGLADVCRQLGEQGSRGKRSRQLQCSLLSSTNLPALGKSLPLLRGPTDNASRKGRAILIELLQISKYYHHHDNKSQNGSGHGEDRSIAHTVLPDWSTVDCDECSIPTIVDQFLSKSGRDDVSSIGFLVDWLWRGAASAHEHMSSSVVVNQRNDAILECIRAHADWIPLSALARRYLTYLNDQLPLRLAPKPFTERLDSVRQLNTIYPDMLLAYIDGDGDWGRLWLKWLQDNGSSDLVQRVLLVYHQCCCLDGSSVDPDNKKGLVSSIRSACKTLQGLLNTLSGWIPISSTMSLSLLKRELKICPLAGTLALFGTLSELPYIQSQRDDHDDPICTLCRLAKNLSQILDFSSVSLEPFLLSVIDFASFGPILNPHSCWIQNATAQCRYWRAEDVCQVWVSVLLRHMNYGAKLNHILCNVNESLLRLVWTETSLISVLVQATKTIPFQYVEYLVEQTPPDLFFSRIDEVSLHTQLESALVCFRSNKTWPKILLAMSLRLEATSVEHSKGYAWKCLVLARAFLLDKIRTCQRGSGDIAHFRSAHGHVQTELTARRAHRGLEWWNHVCRDILDRPEYMPHNDKYGKNEFGAGAATSAEIQPLENDAQKTTGCKSTRDSSRVSSYRPKRARTLLDSLRPHDTVCMDGNDNRPGAREHGPELPVDDSESTECGNERIERDSDTDDYDESNDGILLLNL